MRYISNMTKTQIGVASAALGAAAGAAAGYIFTVKRVEAIFNEIADKEIAEMKEHYSKRYKRDEYADPMSLVDPAEAVVELENYVGRTDEVEIVDEVPNYVAKVQAEGYVSPSAEAKEPVVKNVFVEHASNDDEWVWEDELRKREETDIYVITDEEFLNNESGYEQSTLSYFVEDDTLCDERDQLVNNVAETVGVENLNRFGHGSKDPNIVYIRNDKLDLEVEIVQNQGKYAEQVLGFIEHDEVDRRIRKFRSDRE